MGEVRGSCHYISIKTLALKQVTTKNSDAVCYFVKLLNMCKYKFTTRQKMLCRKCRIYCLVVKPGAVNTKFTIHVVFTKFTT